MDTPESNQIADQCSSSSNSSGSSEIVSSNEQIQGKKMHLYETTNHTNKDEEVGALSCSDLNDISDDVDTSQSELMRDENQLAGEEVDCGKRVSMECIKAFLIRKCDQQQVNSDANSEKRTQQISQQEADCMHLAMAEIESIKPRSILRNCELKIVSGVENGCNPVFVSGKKTNKFLVFGRGSGASPEFVTHSCGVVGRRHYWGSVRYLEWLQVFQVILSAVAFLWVVFYDMDQLHLDMPVDGCLDIKVKMFSALTSSSPYNYQSYCGAPQDSSSISEPLMSFIGGGDEATSSDVLGDPDSFLSKANDFFNQLGQMTPK